MTARKAFIGAKVGEGGQRRGQNVTALQRLMISAAALPAGSDDGRWGPTTRGALLAFREARKASGAALRPDELEAELTRDYVDPADATLLELASEASILVELPGRTGAAGALELHDWFIENGIKYNRGAEDDAGGGNNANRALYGAEAHAGYAVQTIAGRWSRGPVEMDCTTYVNAMLSVFQTGDVRSGHYDASCRDFGATGDHLARERYGFPLVMRTVVNPKSTKVETRNYFDTAEDIREAVTANDEAGLYVIEIGNPRKDGAVGHMAILHRDSVYECSSILVENDSACISRDLDVFTKANKGRIFYLFRQP